MFEVHHGHYGILPGDGYKLISTSKVYEGTRTDCWAYFLELPVEDQLEHLVMKPDWSVGEGGYPTRWDDFPEDLV